MEVTQVLQHEGIAMFYGQKESLIQSCVPFSNFKKKLLSTHHRADREDVILLICDQVVAAKARKGPKDLFVLL